MTDAEFWADVATEISGQGTSEEVPARLALHPYGARTLPGTLFEQMHEERSAACDYGIPGHPLFVADKQDPIGFIGDNLDDEIVDLGEAHDLSPCPECGATGACAYDSQGRPMIHVPDGEGN